MSIYKRGDVYWYKFMWKGQVIRESTKQGNDKVARQMEATHRTSLAKGEVGIREKKPALILKEFCERRFEPWAQATFEHTCRNNWLWFRAGIRRLTRYEPLANAKLDEITGEKLAGFAAYEQTRGLAVSSINSAIRVLRRVLSLAVEWGALESAPKLALLPGERHRERVITPDEEMRYLAAASPLLADVASVLADTGLRPDECYQSRWNAAGKPSEGWAWPAPTRSEHIDHSSLKKQHAKAFRAVNREAKKNSLKPIAPFVLYSFRHTFLTRLGESGCDAWTLARIAGHSSIVISMRYVHPSDDLVLNAMTNLGGHNSGHSALKVTDEGNSLK